MRCLEVTALVALALTAVQTAPAPSAIAAEGERGRMIDRAQALVNEASARYRAGDYEAALAALQKAEPLAERASDPALAGIRFNIARCLEQLGRLEEALAAYELYDLLPDAPHRKQKAFEAERALERQLFGVLTVDCRPVGATVRIAGVTDGPQACPFQSARVRPGRYDVLVEAAGYAGETQAVEVQAGRAASASVQLTRRGGDEQVRLGVEAPAPGPGIDPLPWTFVGGGAVAAGVGGVFTALAIGARDEAESTPPGATQDGAASDFDTFRAVSYVLYGVGAAAAATGAVLFFTGGGDDPEAVVLTPAPGGFTVRF